MFAIGDKEWPGISKLVEECGEVLQVAGKLMGTRGDPAHWSGDMREALVEEMADLVAALAFVADQCLTEREREAMASRTETKFERFQGWHKEGGA
jgi:NTP pyrophosphatase (non-canonical NTP hydrolase)